MTTDLLTRARAAAERVGCQKLKELLAAWDIQDAKQFPWDRSRANLNMHVVKQHIGNILAGIESAERAHLPGLVEALRTIEGSLFAMGELIKAEILPVSGIEKTHEVAVKALAKYEPLLEDTHEAPG
jgi:hypothetical protein